MALAFSVVFGLVLFGYAILFQDSFIGSGDTDFLQAFIIIVGVSAACWWIYSNNTRRNTLLKRFARDNNFQYAAKEAVLGDDSLQRFTSGSLLLQPQNSFGRGEASTSDFALTGIYNNLSFDIRIVSMWSQTSNGQGVRFFGVVTLTCNSSWNSPHVVALVKDAPILGNDLNVRSIVKPEWNPETIGWRANADYTIYSEAETSNLWNPSLKEEISSMLSELYKIGKPCLEINNGTIYLLLPGGLDYSKPAFRDIFAMMEIVSKYTNSDTSKKETP